MAHLQQVEAQSACAGHSPHEASGPAAYVQNGLEGGGGSTLAPPQRKPTSVIFQLWATAEGQNTVSSGTDSKYGSCDLVAIFDDYLFPNYLYAYDRETSRCSEDFIGSGGGGGVSSEELREWFHTFISIGQQCVQAALGTDAWDQHGASRYREVCDDGHHCQGAMSSADEDPGGCGGVPAFCPSDENQPHSHPGRGKGDIAGTALMCLLSLAFSSSCAPLSLTAQLILADALAAYPATSAASDKCYRLLQYFPWVHHPISAAAAVFDDSSLAIPQPEPQESRTRLNDSAGPVGILRFRELVYRPDDVVLWVDQQRIPHADTLRNCKARLQAQGSPCYFTHGWLPTTTSLPFTERFLFSVSQALSFVGEERFVAATLRTAGRELDALKMMALTNSLPTHRRGRVESPPVEPGQEALPSKVPETEGCTAMSPPSPSTMAVIATRQQQLLMALSRTHSFPTPTARAEAHEILYAAFAESSDCPSYYRILSLYPEFLRAHHAAMRCVLWGDGPLPIADRLMIAVMAASRHRCEYLVARFASLLLKCTQAHGATSPGASGRPGSAKGAGGSPCEDCAHESWLLNGPPPRLAAAQRLIALAAHTPWLISPGDYKDLLQAGWTVPQLLQLIAITAHLLPLSSFVLGLFVPTEPWTWAVLPAAITAALRHTALQQGACENTGFSASLRPSNHHNCCLNPSPYFASPSDIFLRYAGEAHVVSEQRIRGNAAINQHSLWRNQFCWSESGATSMEEYYPGAAALITEEFDSFNDIVRLLDAVDCVKIGNTHHVGNCGSSLGKSGSLRRSPPARESCGGYSAAYTFRSLQLYVLNLLGFMVEDYPYNDINKVLRRPAKWFAQALTTRPEALQYTEVLHWATFAASPTRRAGHWEEAAVGCGGVLPRWASIEVMAAQTLKREVDLLQFVLPPAPAPSTPDGARETHVRPPPVQHCGGVLHVDTFDKSSTATTSTATGAPTAEAEALAVAIGLQEERALLLTAVATMVARTEGLLHISLYPLWMTLNNM